MTVVDNNVLSALAKIERLDLLKSFFGEVLTTPKIIHELKSENIAGYKFSGRILSKRAYEGNNEDKWIVVTEVNAQEKEMRDGLTEKNISFADAECLSVAINRNEILLTDDTHLINIAKEMNVAVFDLETFLEACVLKGLITSFDDAEKILSDLEEKDFYTFSEKFKKELKSILKTNQSKK